MFNAYLLNNAAMLFRSFSINSWNVSAQSNFFLREWINVTDIISIIKPDISKLKLCFSLAIHFVLQLWVKIPSCTKGNISNFTPNFLTSSLENGIYFIDNYYCSFLQKCHLNKNFWISIFTLHCFIVTAI